jgi:hypothetical protein
MSVLRGFTDQELARDFVSAGLTSVDVRRRFFFRLVASGGPPRSRPAAETTL